MNPGNQFSSDDLENAIRSLIKHDQSSTIKLVCSDSKFKIVMVPPGTVYNRINGELVKVGSIPMKKATSKRYASKIQFGDGEDTVVLEKIRADYYTCIGGNTEAPMLGFNILIVSRVFLADVTVMGQKFESLQIAYGLSKMETIEPPQNCNNPWENLPRGPGGIPIACNFNCGEEKENLRRIIRNLRNQISRRNKKQQIFKGYQNFHGSNFIQK